jgi:hypothetical protein
LEFILKVKKQAILGKDKIVNNIMKSSIGKGGDPAFPIEENRS